MGGKNNLDEFIKNCKIGNKDSVVEDVHLSEIPPVVFESFEVIDEETSVCS